MKTWIGIQNDHGEPERSLELFTYYQQVHWIELWYRDDCDYILNVKDPWGQVLSKQICFKDTTYHVFQFTEKAFCPPPVSTSMVTYWFQMRILYSKNTTDESVSSYGEDVSSYGEDVSS